MEGAHEEGGGCPAVTSEKPVVESRDAVHTRVSVVFDGIVCCEGVGLAERNFAIADGNLAGNWIVADIVLVASVAMRTKRSIELLPYRATSSTRQIYIDSTATQSVFVHRCLLDTPLNKYQFTSCMYDEAPSC